MPIIAPTTGQLQIPGEQQSVARIICSVGSPTSITQSLTVPGQPGLATPDYGFIAWRYVFGGVARYGIPISVRLSEMLIASDQPQFEFDQLLVVPRLGVTMNVSLRRTAI